MVQPDMSPSQHGLRPERGSNLQPDDIELPPLPEPKLDATVLAERERQVSSSKEGLGPFKQIAMAIGILTTLAIGSWLLRNDAGSESAAPNWKHVAAATAASNSAGENRFMRVDAAGHESIVSTLVLTSADADPTTTIKVRSALANNDVAAAVSALQGSQPTGGTQMTGKSVEFDPAALQGNAQIASAIKDNRSHFFRVMLSDSCFEDGDVVELDVNGQTFATVPITNRGFLLPIPLQPGRTDMTIRGVHDGGGSITTMFTSNEGHCICKDLEVGEEMHVVAIVQ